MSNGELYAPRYYDPLSPTWFQWNKLTAYDILHHIRSEPNFGGQDVWFWLNHPIQFFQVVGLVVQIDSVANGRYTLITIDDASGANMEVKIERKAARREGEAEWTENSYAENVDVFVEMGLPVVLLHGKRVEVGEVMQVKGTLTTFRSEKQIVVKRLRRVKDTNQEAVWWSLMADWKRTTLSRPWVISKEAMAKVDREQRQEKKESKKADMHDLRRAQRRKEWEEQHAEKEEAKRSRLEEKMNMHALEGSDVLPRPWD